MVTGPNGATIMIVDDDVDIRETLHDILVSEGYQVVVAENGLQALQVLRAASGPLPRLILLDLGMPVMSGGEFRELQRGDPRWSAIPTVVITASGATEKTVEGLEPSAVLQKPFRVDALMAAVSRFCGSPPTA